MTKFKQILVLFCSLMIFSGLANAQTPGSTSCGPDLEKYVIIIDTSGSVNSTEFAFFQDAADDMVDLLLDGTRNAEVAILQYNTDNTAAAKDHLYDVVVHFTDSATTAKRLGASEYGFRQPLIRIYTGSFARFISINAYRWGLE